MRLRHVSAMLAVALPGASPGSPPRAPRPRHRAPSTPPTSGGRRGQAVRLPAAQPRRDRQRQRRQGRRSPAATRLPNGDPAFAFNGAGEHLKFASRGAFSIPTTGTLTVEYWIRPDTLQFSDSEGSGYVYILGKGSRDRHEWYGRMYYKHNSENRPNRISGYALQPERRLRCRLVLRGPRHARSLDPRGARVQHEADLLGVPDRLREDLQERLPARHGLAEGLRHRPADRAPRCASAPATWTASSRAPSVTSRSTTRSSAAPAAGALKPCDPERPRRRPGPTPGRLVVHPGSRLGALRGRLSAGTAPCRSRHRRACPCS